MLRTTSLVIVLFSLFAAGLGCGGAKAVRGDDVAEGQSLYTIADLSTLWFQAQIIELSKRLRDELGMAIVWITHDLGVIAGLARRVSVMYGGYLIEEALVNELYANPQHPYTIGLLGSLPRLDSTRHQRLYSIEGLPPVLYDKPNACPFAPRCKWAMERCWKENPVLETLAPEHRAACWVDTQTGRSRS